MCARTDVQNDLEESCPQAEPKTAKLHAISVLGCDCQSSMHQLLPYTTRQKSESVGQCLYLSDSDVVATEQTWPHVTIWTLNYADRTPTPGTTCSGTEFVFVYLHGLSPSIRKTLWLCAALMWHDVSFQSLTILLAQCTSCPWDFILPFPKVLKDIWMWSISTVFAIPTVLPSNSIEIFK